MSLTFKWENYGKVYLKFSPIFKYLLFDPAVFFWEYIQRKRIQYMKGVCAPMFVVAQFTIAKIWNEPGFPSNCTGGKKDNVVYTCKWLLLSHKSEIIAAKWLKLKNHHAK